MAGDELADRAAHRGSDDVGPRNATGVEQAHGIRRHVVQPVGYIGALAPHHLADHIAEVGAAPGVEARRQAAVAIVEAHDVEAGRYKPLAKGVGPMDELGAQPHDQKHRRVRRVAEPLIFDVQAIRSGARHIFAAA